MDGAFENPRLVEGVRAPLTDLDVYSDGESAPATSASRRAGCRRERAAAAWLMQNLHHVSWRTGSHHLDRR
jgi:hypothetical protein